MFGSTSRGVKIDFGGVELIVLEARICNFYLELILTLKCIVQLTFT